MVGPWSKVGDGVVLLDVRTSPIPDRDILARKGTLACDAHSAVLHGEMTGIDHEDHVSGIASLAPTRSVNLGHVSVSDAIDGVGGALTMVPNGNILIWPGG